MKPFKQPPLTQARLRELLSYDLKSRVFTWVISTTPRITVGDRAGTFHRKRNGRFITIDRSRYREESLAVFWLTGGWEQPGPFFHRIYERAHTNPGSSSSGLFSIIEDIRNAAPHGTTWLDAIQIILDRNQSIDMQDIALQIQLDQRLFRAIEDEARQARLIKPTKPTEGQGSPSVEVRHQVFVAPNPPKPPKAFCAPSAAFTETTGTD